MFELTAEQKRVWRKANNSVHYYRLAQALETQLARALKAEFELMHDANEGDCFCWDTIEHPEHPEILPKPNKYHAFNCEGDWLAEARRVLGEK